MDPAETLARTLYAEAGERPVRALEALAALVVARARAALAEAAPGRPATPARLALAAAGACRAPFAFACWNPRDPRHTRLSAPHPGDAALAMCRRIAARALAGSLPDPTGGATHVHEAERLPRWAVARVPVAEVGGLLFYRLDPAPAPRPAAPARPVAVRAA